MAYPQYKICGMLAAVISLYLTLLNHSSSVPISLLFPSCSNNKLKISSTVIASLKPLVKLLSHVVLFYDKISFISQ